MEGARKLTVLVGLCGTDAVAIASDSMSLSHLENRVLDLSTVKAFPVLKRFAFAHTGGNGAILDPLRFDFSRVGPGRNPPLQPGARPDRARYDRVGESDLPLLLRRLDAQCAPSGAFDENLASLRSFLLHAFRQEVKIAQFHDWAMYPWTETVWFAGYGADGIGRLAEFQFSGDCDGVDCTKPVVLRHNGPPGDMRGIATAGYRHYAHDWLTAHEWPLSPETELRATAERLVSYCVERSLQEEGSRAGVGGDVQIVVTSPKGPARREIYEDGAWRESGPRASDREPARTTRLVWGHEVN